MFLKFIKKNKHAKIAMKSWKTRAKNVGEVHCKMATNLSHPWMYVTLQYNIAVPPNKRRSLFLYPLNLRLAIWIALVNGTLSNMMQAWDLKSVDAFGTYPFSLHFGNWDHTVFKKKKRQLPLQSENLKLKYYFSSVTFAKILRPDNTLCCQAVEK